MDLPFDLLPLPTASIGDLDLEFFKNHYLPNAVAPDILEENTRTLEDQLKSLRFLTPEGIPTTLGMLVTGKEPRHFIPGAYIQFVRFEGKEFTDPIRNQKEITGHLRRLIERLDDLLDANINVAAEITSGPVEIHRPDYPIPALQQLCRNAILHRTYEGTAAPVRVYWFSDRVDIHNPGGPFGQVTKDNFGQPHLTDYRNFHLAEAMKVLGYVQRFGVGIEIARRELQKNGNPPVCFRVESTNILATVKIRETL